MLEIVYLERFCIIWQLIHHMSITAVYGGIPEFWPTSHSLMVHVFEMFGMLYHHFGTILIQVKCILSYNTVTLMHYPNTVIE